MTDHPRRFSPPWDIDDNGACFIVRDHNGQALSVITLTRQYVARALGKAAPISFNAIEKYAYDNAGDLKAMALLEKGSGRLNLILGPLASWQKITRLSAGLSPMMAALDDRFHEPDHGTGDLLVDSSFAVR